MQTELIVSADVLAPKCANHRYTQLADCKSKDVSFLISKIINKTYLYIFYIFNKKKTLKFN